MSYQDELELLVVGEEKPHTVKENQNFEDPCSCPQETYLWSETLS